MKPKTAVLSARIPTEIIKEIDRICKQRKISRSEWVTSTLAKDKTNEVMQFSRGGKIQVQASTIPKELQNLLAGLGLLTAGITLYSLTRDVLSQAKNDDGKPKFTASEVEIISGSTLVILAIVGAGAFNAILNES